MLRTLNKQPISPELWHHTLDDLARHFPVDAGDDLLDLCCGNGLFAAHFAESCRSVTAVDVSDSLLERLRAMALPNVTVESADIRKLRLAPGRFSRVLVYAGIQYLSEAECVSLMRRMFDWLRPGGILFVGDIPDRELMWTFYDTPERRAAYFENCLAGEDVVGTWYGRDWLEHLALDSGFREADALSQDPKLIYSHFRFDLRCVR